MLAPRSSANRIIDAMSPTELLRLDAWFEAWAHEGQLPPEGEGWRVWLMMAGRGFGKTRAGAEWIHRAGACAARRADRAGRGDDRTRRGASWSRASAGC